MIYDIRRLAVPRADRDHGHAHYHAILDHRLYYGVASPTSRGRDRGPAAITGTPGDHFYAGDDAALEAVDDRAGPGPAPDRGNDDARNGGKA